MKLIGTWNETDWEGSLYTDGYFNGCPVLSTRPYTPYEIQNENHQTESQQVVGVDRIKFRYKLKTEVEWRGWDLPVMNDPDFRITFYNENDFFTYGREGEYKARFGFPPGMTSFLHLFEYYWHIIDIVYLPSQKSYPNDNVYLK